MTDYQIYVFLMCLIVFFMLASLSIFCISVIMRLTLRLINHGVEDEKILEEYRKQEKKHKATHSKLFSYAFSGIVCLVLLVMLIFAFVVKGTEGSFVDSLPVYRVVNTGSMSKKNPQNTYLTKNNLNDQIQTFDLIKTEKLPDEMDLELYDIVVYETNGVLVVHRIVEIEEPNSYHPNCRHFRLQGDAVDAPDRFPVLYEQMHAIYRGERIPFIGSFIMFMQSPAGWLCFLFVFLSIFAMPVLENKLQDAKNRRLLLYIKKDAPVSEPEKYNIIALVAEQGKTGKVNLQNLDINYNSGDFVDIQSLKKKVLIDHDCKRVDVVANGQLSKALTVKANSFEPEAIVAITTAGGEAIRAFNLVEAEDAIDNADSVVHPTGGEQND